MNKILLSDFLFNLQKSSLDISQDGDTRSLWFYFCLPFASFACGFLNLYWDKVGTKYQSKHRAKAVHPLVQLPTLLSPPYTFGQKTANHSEVSLVSPPVSFPSSPRFLN